MDCYVDWRGWSRAHNHSPYLREAWIPHSGEIVFMDEADELIKRHMEEMKLESNAIHLLKERWKDPPAVLAKWNSTMAEECPHFMLHSIPFLIRERARYGVHPNEIRIVFFFDN